MRDSDVSSSLMSLNSPGSRPFSGSMDRVLTQYGMTTHMPTTSTKMTIKRTSEDVLSDAPAYGGGAAATIWAEVPPLGGSMDGGGGDVAVEVPPLPLEDVAGGGFAADADDDDGDGEGPSSESSAAGGGGDGIGGSGAADGGGGEGDNGG